MKVEKSIYNPPLSVLPKISPFDTVRERLEKQYENAFYDPSSGLSSAELESEFAVFQLRKPEASRMEARAFLLHLIFTRGRIAPEPDNMFAGKVEHSPLPRALRSQWEKTSMDAAFTQQELQDASEMGCVFSIDTSHVSPDWCAILSLGLPGLRTRAASGDSELHRAATLILDGVIELSRRIGHASHNQALLAIAERPPETLYEAFQLAYLMHECIEQEGESVRTMGWFDRLYIDFYRRDLARGILTPETAAEMIKYFWIAFYAKHQGKMFGKNFCFGPQINELSYLGMEVYDQLNTVDPKLSIRVDPATDRQFLLRAASNIVRGRTGIVILNDQVVIPGLIAHGRKPEDAANYIPIGCYEPAVLGKEISTSGATHLLLPKLMETLLKLPGEYPDFSAFYQKFFELLHRSMEIMVAGQLRCERLWPMVNPAPLLSATFEQCMDTGLDISEGGAQYNSTGVVLSHLADAVDSLAAVEYLVFEKKICTLEDLNSAIAANWKGFEKLNRMARRLPPKWGNNDSAADKFAVEIAKTVAKRMNSTPNARGGHFFCSIYGQSVVKRGQQIGALPDGRFAGEPLAKNLDAVISMDRSGITALLHSVMKLDMIDFPCGACLDLMLHPSALEGNSGSRLLLDLQETFLSGGGSGLQFNILNLETLRAAREHPELYPGLQIRVCGWNARFTDLCPEEQDTFIKQAEAML